MGGGTVRLFQEIGWGNAMRYLLTGDEMTGSEGPEAAFSRRIPDLMPIMESQDAIEGVMSFIERREANFKGK